MAPTRAVASGLLLLVLMAAAGGQAAGPFQNIAAALGSRSDLTVLSAAAAGGLLPRALTSGGLDSPYTLFLPSDKAFLALAKQRNTSLIRLLSNPKDLVTILSYHVLPGAALLAKDVPLGDTSLKTLNGANVTVTKTVVGGKTIITVTDYYGRVANVTKADITAAKSVIHLIDQVLLPPPTSVPTPSPSGNVATLAEVLKKAGDLSVLSMAADAIFGSATLPSLANTTILAPTDTAFAALLSIAQKLNIPVDLGNLSPAVKALFQSILKTHLVPGRYLAADLKDAAVLATAGSATLTVDLKTKPGAVMFKVNGVPKSTATVLKADILAANGIVVHKIDAVLSPIDLSILG